MNKKGSFFAGVVIFVGLVTLLMSVFPELLSLNFSERTNPIDPSGGGAFFIMGVIAVIIGILMRQSRKYASYSPAYAK